MNSKLVKGFRVFGLGIVLLLIGLIIQAGERRDGNSSTAINSAKADVPPGGGESVCDSEATEGTGACSGCASVEAVL